MFKINNKGFSLIELMIVLMIIGLLTTLVIYNIGDEPDLAKIKITQAQITSFEKALERYKFDNGVYPSTEQGLEALVKKPAAGTIPKNWKQGGYLDFIPKDPWNNKYIYICPGINRTLKFDIESYGADSLDGGEGINSDIENWQKDKW